MLSAEEPHAFKQQTEARIVALTRDRETRAERAAREFAARRQVENVTSNWVQIAPAKFQVSVIIQMVMLNLATEFGSALS